MTPLVPVIAALRGRHVGGRARRDGAMDTTPAAGARLCQIGAALAPCERRVIQERTQAGLAAARARGKHGGRTPRHAEAPRVRMADTRHGDQHWSGADLCPTLRISPATF
jgi:DNA invertase Pin-like site-specific DNA recombinase